MADGTSLRDQLQATYDKLAADETPQDGGAAQAGTDNGAQGAAGAEAGAAAAATPEPVEAKPEGDEKGPRRGPDGKFAPKTDDTAAPAAEGASAQPPAEAKTESAEPATPGPEDQATRVPPSLSAAVKAQWSDLPQAVRDEFARLEDTFQKGKAEWGSKGQRLNRLDEIIGPHVDRWRMAGLDEFSGIQALIAAQSQLDRDPVSGILHIARTYGLTPAHLAQAFGIQQANGQGQGAEGQAAPTGAPDLQAALQSALSPVLTQVQTLQQQLTQSEQARQAADLKSFQQIVDDFAARPENLYFANVIDDVADRVQKMRAAGAPPTAETLKQAYDAAIWADHTIRPHLITAQAKAEASEKARAEAAAKAEADKAAREKAQRAAAASGSVTGAPTAGAQAPGGPPGSVRDTLMAAMKEHSAAV